MIKNYFLFVISFLFFLQISTAQSKSFDLREMDGLVVRLESGQNKTQVIQQKLEASNTEEMKKYWEQELKNLELELKIKNQNVRTAFEQEFKFVDVFYIYDYAAKELKRGKIQGIFLDKNLQVDPAIELEGDNFLLAAEGQSTSTAEGIYLHHNDLTRLTDRQLNFVKLNTIGLIFNNIFSSGDATQQMYQKAIGKLNRRFYKSQRIVK